MDNLIKRITNRIQDHHTLYDLPVFGELWEEVLHKSFSDIGQKTDWTPTRSHKSGVDMTHETLGRISCKSGVLSPSGILDLNGSRTTQFSTLEEKLDFLSIKKEDSFFCLSRLKSDWENGKKRYHLFVFNSDILDYKSALWEETNGGWKGSGSYFNATITKKMSDQLWVKLNTQFIDNSYLVDVT